MTDSERREQARTYPPGTVAKATVAGYKNVTVLRSRGPKEWFAASDIVTGCFSEGGSRHSRVTNIRPLIVLDPQRFNVEWVCDVLRGGGSQRLRPAGAGGDSYVADQMEEQTRKPRPPEPTGLGAVVVASCQHDPNRVLWVSVGNGMWAPEGHPSHQPYLNPWNTLIDPTELRGGYKP